MKDKKMNHFLVDIVLNAESYFILSVIMFLYMSAFSIVFIVKALRGEMPILDNIGLVILLAIFMFIFGRVAYLSGKYRQKNNLILNTMKCPKCYKPMACSEDGKKFNCEECDILLIDDDRTFYNHIEEKGKYIVKVGNSDIKMQKITFVVQIVVLILTIVLFTLICLLLDKGYSSLPLTFISFGVVVIYMGFVIGFLGKEHQKLSKTAKLI